MLKIILITGCFIFQVATVFEFTSPRNLETSNIIIAFNPHISILDIYDRSRYKTDDMVAMVSKVATRFTKLFLKFDFKITDPRNSIFLSIISIAQYNCLNTTTTKTELFLSVTTGDTCNCSKVQDIFPIFAAIADETNKVCNETVHTIVLDSRSIECPSLLATCGQELHLTERYKWGERFPVADYCNATQLWNSTLRPTVVVLDYSTQTAEDVFTIDVAQCQPYRNDTNWKPIIIKEVGFTDTRVDKIIDIKALVSFWQMVTKERKFNFILHQAFDAYSWSKAKSEMTTTKNGWWYLAKDPGTTNTSEFIFEEKIKVADRIDNEENLKYLPWYRDKLFDKNSSGLIFQKNIRNVAVRNDFCRLLSIQELDDLADVVNNAVRMMATCGESFQLYLLRNKLSLKDLSYLLELKDQITILIPVDNSILTKGYVQKYPETIKELGFKLGFYIDLEYCGFYNQFNTSLKHIINDIFTDPRSSIYLFVYEDYQDTVNLGARQMFRLRNVLFEACKKLVFQNRSTSVELGFAAKAIYKENNFYESPWAMKNYLKYINLMSKWAENHSNTVVFLGPDEDRSFIDSFNRTWNTTGWYSYNDYIEKIGAKPKQISLLNNSNHSNSDKEYITYFGLKNDQFIITTCSVLVFVFSIILTLIWFTRRYRKKCRLSYEESTIFFNGRSVENESGDNDPSNIPYDKDKYEIAERNFKIDTSESLGSGEFGKVYRGTVSSCDDTDIQVAVKTTNPQKPHKTMLNGLLSEIKLLSYLGQHQHIIKLLGANTSSLKNGKVYVFLELCHLGSLRSYLQQLRISEPLANTETNEVEMTNKYVNLTSGRKYMLDASLSDDLYRWSTEICNGMEYLAGKHVVHADLATRNVLLNLRREAKICDFGLSRRMYNYTSYVKTQQEPLPWKWLAPEALRYMQFNEKTDVWAFGITLWEIYSLGSLPYAGLSWDINFVQMLEGGLVPSEPDFEEKNMYKLMQNCWKILPDQRPSFSQISSSLISVNYVDVDD